MRKKKVLTFLLAAMITASAGSLSVYAKPTKEPPASFESYWDASQSDKADETAPTLNALSGRYGQKLSDIILPENYAWTNPDMVLDEIGEKQYEVVHTVDGDDQASQMVSVTVKKAIPEYTVPQDLKGKYGNDVSSIILPEGFSWQNTDDKLETIGKSSFMAVFRPEDTEHYECVKNIEISVTIEKADPKYEIPANLTGKYKDKITDIALPKGFKWQNPNDILSKTGKVSFLASYTPEDTEHYNTVKDIKIEISVKKADPEFTLPTGLFGFAGEKLETVELPEGFSWKDANTVLDGSGNKKYLGVFTPSDTENFNVIEDIEISVMVHAGKLDPEYEIPTGLTGKYRDKITDIALPKGFKWQNPNDILSKTGKVSFLASYTPEDTEHYNTVKDIKIEISVKKADPEFTLPTGLFGFAGEKLETVELPEGFSWKDANTVLDGSGNKKYLGVFTPSDTENFNVIEDIEISVMVHSGKIDPEYTIPESVTGSYGDTLGFIKLPDKFKWVNEDLKLETLGVTEYTALYIPEDTKHYNTMVVRIPVDVKKGILIIETPKTSYNLTYGQRLSDIVLPSNWAFERPESLLNAGSYTIEVYLSVDKEHYDIQGPESDISSVLVNIGKATPGYTIPPTISIKPGTRLTNDLLPKSSTGSFEWDSDAAPKQNGRYYCSFYPYSNNYNPVHQIGVNVVITRETSGGGSSKPSGSGSSSDTGSNNTGSGNTGTGNSGNTNGSNNSSQGNTGKPNSENNNTGSSSNEANKNNTSTNTNDKFSTGNNFGGNGTGDSSVTDIKKESITVADADTVKKATTATTTTKKKLVRPEQTTNEEETQNDSDEDENTTVTATTADQETPVEETASSYNSSAATGGDASQIETSLVAEAEEDPDDEVGETTVEQEPTEQKSPAGMIAVICAILAALGGGGFYYYKKYYKKDKTKDGPTGV